MIYGLEYLWLARKRLPAPRNWVEVKPDYLELVSPLDIEEVTIQNLRLRITARKSLPDECITAQLEYFVERKIGGPFCRFEWKPIKGHNNHSHGPPDLHHVVQTGTHYHGFEINWHYCAKFVRKGNLPISIPVTKPLHSYKDAIDFMADEFKIDNVEFVPPPPWEEALL